MSSRTQVGEAGTSWVRQVTSGSTEQWLAAVWVRDLDGRRRLVKARRPKRREAEQALQQRLAQRRPLGFRGAEPNMTVQELGEYWMRRRLEEARAPATKGRRDADEGAVSLQTLAGYQHALSRIINPRLGGLRLSEARTGVVDEALAQVDLSGRTTRVARSVLAQMFAMAVRHDALTANPMREVRRQPRRRRVVEALTVEQARNLLELTRCHRDGIARDERGLLLGGAQRTPDLYDVALLLLGTGMRIGEALALKWTDLDLDAEAPYVRVAATLVEPRRDAASGQVFVAGLHPPTEDEDRCSPHHCPTVRRRRDGDPASSLDVAARSAAGLRSRGRRLVVAEQCADQVAWRGRGHALGRGHPTHATSDGGHLGRSQRGPRRRQGCPRPP